MEVVERSLGTVEPHAHAWHVLIKKTGTYNPTITRILEFLNHENFKNSQEI